MRASQRRQCPQCKADSVELSLLNVKRLRRVTCPPCGAKLEIVVPDLPYRLVTWTVAILASLLAPTFLVLVFARQWATIGLAVVLLFALIFGSNEMLNRRATVQLAAEPDPRESKLRRWFRR
ncbi:MAG TPA: hypothetical protein VFU13_07140 [Steroidobacteraceae bacterium]|nr:hypothetical protein [Steroidobacteraceae bacterium]